MITFTEDQAAALVTDAGTLKRGRELAGPTKWGNLGRTDTAAWGECAGSGSKPYLTGIDLSEPAFKCSCPSRVFPCKHGVGLLLLLARQPALLPAGAPPAWLAEWLEKRQAKGDEQAEKAAKTAKKAPTVSATSTAEAAPDAADAPAAPNAAQQKREAQRHARMQAGALDLETWLLDLLRAGLAELERKPASLWEDQAARLVDNQLPGLAAVLRELAELPTAGPDWTQRLLGRLGELYVLVRAFLNRDHLAPAARQDVWQQVGIPPKKDDLLAGPAAVIVADTWLVLGQYAWEEERVTGRRSWLFGQNSGRTALVLDFAFGRQPFATALVPQGKYAGELVFYPGLLPLRAAPVSLAYKGSAADATPPGQSPGDLLESYATALGRQPWLRQWPAALGPVLPTPLPNGRWLLHHATEPLALPLRVVDEEIAWQWLAFSGGRPLTLFGEWDGQAYLPLISWTEDQDAAGNELVLDDFFVTGASAGQPVDALVSAVVTSIAGASAAAVSSDAAATVGNSVLVSNSTAASTVLEKKSIAAEAPTLESALTAADIPTWPPLLRLALLGTRQSAEVLPAFPALPATGSREQHLLLAAGALALLHKAGYVPTAGAAATPAPAPAPPDQLPTLGPLGTESLHRMLISAQYLDLLPDYLRQLAAAGRRVPEALLMPLLQHATRSVEVRSHLGAVLGERGRWLAALNPAWARLFTTAAPAETDPADLATWETGLLPERLAWLRQAFARDAEAARALLLAALPTEPAKVQEALLKVLADHLHPDAEATLETLLKSRGQEVRRQAAALLVRLPGAALTERLWARAAPLITTKRKLLGLGKAALEITLPTAWDKSWLADGIEEKNDHYTYLTGNTKAAVGAGAARLANMLALLPVSRWLAHLSLSADELLEAALASEWAVPLLPAWALSTLAHQDAGMAAAFVRLWLGQSLQLQKLKIHLDVEPLAALLPAATQQQLLVPKLVLHLNRSGAEWEPALAALEQTRVLPGPWPRALTEAALAVVARHTAGTASPAWLPYERRRFGSFISETLLEKLAPADAPAAQLLLATIAEPHEFYADQFRDFGEALRFKADLAASLREPV